MNKWHQADEEFKPSVDGKQSLSQQIDHWRAEQIRRYEHCDPMARHPMVSHTHRERERERERDAVPSRHDCATLCLVHLAPLAISNNGTVDVYTLMTRTVEFGEYRYLHSL
jgi:hypothetical protein